MATGLGLPHAGFAPSSQGRLFPLLLVSRTLISLLSGRSKCLPFSNMRFLGMERAVFRCQKCLNEFTKEFDSCPMCNGGVVEKYELLVEEVVPLFSELDLPFTLDPSKHQYKIITQKDRFFSSKFNPALIERALNEYAQEGWVLKNAVSADFGSVGMSRNELIIFLEKAPNGKVNS